jgi:hypothetical protein
MKSFSEYKSHDDEPFISCPKKHKYLALNEAKLDRTCPRTELSTFLQLVFRFNPRLAYGPLHVRGTTLSLISGSFILAMNKHLGK